MSSAPRGADDVHACTRKNVADEWSEHGSGWSRMDAVSYVDTCGKDETRAGRCPNDLRGDMSPALHLT